MPPGAVPQVRPGLHRSRDLLIRSSMCGHPEPSRSVRDLGCVPACCSYSSGFPECCSPRWLPAWLPRTRVHGSGVRLSDLANLRILPAWTRSLISPAATIIPRIFRIMEASAVTARTLQGMARVRSGQAPAWPLSSVRSVRRGSSIKRDFACTFTGVFPPVPISQWSESRLMLEGRARTLSGPSPDLARGGAIIFAALSR